MTVAAYYDDCRLRQIDDFHVRNKRVVSAIEFAKQQLEEAGSVLDVGCGIGWTSSEIAATGVSVTGMDISPALVDTAKSFFGRQCDFVVADFTDHVLVDSYDAVVMIDVFEHFPRQLWPIVYDQLNQTGATVVVLTLPTPATQDYARDHDIPLQPVDETVTEEDIQELADSVNGQVTVNRFVSIWRPNDYRHVSIRREP